MSQADLDSLLIRHLADIEDATRRLDALQHKIGVALNEIAEEWAEAAVWVGGFEWNEDTIWVAPREWRRDSEGKDGDAYFSIYFNNDRDEDEYWITSLCRVGNCEYGIHFKQNVHGVRRGRAIIKDCAEEFVASGFVLDDNRSLFLPLHIDAAVLAEAIANGDIKSALEPLKQAFDKLKNAQPLFDALLEKLKAEK